jgi:hypothetical protein
MKYSISESARIVGVTRKTLYKHIETKPISIEKDEQDRPVIDASELMRVYGDQCRFDVDKGSKSQITKSQNDPENAVPGSLEAAVIQKELDMLRAQMTSDREIFEEQVDYLRKKLDEANSESRKLTALLTDQRAESSRAGEWEKAIKALEQRIANQESTDKEQQERAQKILRQNQALKKALEEERGKSFWKRLFG